MAMQLQAQAREKFGKQNKALRSEGKIPAELYGRGISNLHIAVEVKEFAKIFKDAGENTVIDLMVGEDRHKALIHEVKRNYLTDQVEHVDFYQVRMDEKTQVHIPIELQGEAPAVKEQGGILNRTLDQVEVEALPADLPGKFVLDISGLSELNQSLYIKDLQVPPGVEILIDPETVIVSVTPPAQEEEPIPVAAPDVSQVKVESEEKKAEREKEKEAEE